MKQCTRKGGKGGPCPNTFPASDPRKQCPDCREYFRQHYQKHKASRLASMKKWYSKPEVHSRRMTNQQVYRKSEHGNKSMQKSNRKPIVRLGITLHKMVSGTHPHPVSLVSLGCFQDNDDARGHMESTFEPWMNFANQGPYRVGDAYHTKWNIGHRLPKAIFDSLNCDDLAKCFDRRNLYAQCARENVEYSNKLVLSDDELEGLRSLWPAKAMNNMPALKALFG